MRTTRPCRQIDGPRHRTCTAPACKYLYVIVSYGYGSRGHLAFRHGLKLGLGPLVQSAILLSLGDDCELSVGHYGGWGG